MDGYGGQLHEWLQTIVQQWLSQWHQILQCNGWQWYNGSGHYHSWYHFQHHYCHHYASLSFLTSFKYERKLVWLDKGNRYSKSYGFHKNANQDALLLRSVYPGHGKQLARHYDWYHSCFHYGPLADCFHLDPIILFLPIPAIHDYHDNVPHLCIR